MCLAKKRSNIVINAYYLENYPQKSFFEKYFDPQEQKQKGNPSKFLNIPFISQNLMQINVKYHTHRYQNYVYIKKISLGLIDSSKDLGPPANRDKYWKVKLW